MNIFEINRKVGTRQGSDPLVIQPKSPQIHIYLLMSELIRSLIPTLQIIAHLDVLPLLKKPLVRRVLPEGTPTLGSYLQPEVTTTTT